MTKIVVRNDAMMRTLSQFSVPYRIVLAQLVVGVVVSLVVCIYMLVFFQPGAEELAGTATGLAMREGLAAALGALIVVIPNAWLAWRITGREDAVTDPAGSGESAARILALGLTKFLTTAGAAALVLAMFKPALAGFLAGLVATVLTAALVPPFLAPQQLARTPRLD